MTMAAAGVAKLIEECGELVQILGKRLAMWDQDDHWDGSNLRERMAEEMGDVKAGIEFVSSMFGVHAETEARYRRKHRLFCEWHVDQTNNDHGIDGGPNSELRAALIDWRKNGYHVGLDDARFDLAQDRLKKAIDSL